ncbi:MucB/RseB C-terminal domain-containing protein [Acidovorax sp. NCPPB 3576]|uniref:MucB/RseB C-terminal domain-containing protein n=1 Tax=Acidovorax sp. NCPPB 3576 TaxID=2940488 RepID=UPI00234A509D|nr:MucB/RseB C-terminal domain-containing protein [Acidovorax sp. NCPPB 3576]WCM89566.1 MucB/RseB C-terminal domain-containing protein [Acidovorax sp. NCPPB 3576]
MAGYLQSAASMRRALVWMLMAAGSGQALAGPEPAVAAVASSVVAPGEVRSISGWLERIHRASREHSYNGTFVVLSASGAMVSSRIWHAANGNDQIERIEALSGVPRVVYRREGLVRTFLPQARIVREDRRDMPSLFPRLPETADRGLDAYYTVQTLGRERIAGHESEVAWLRPKDGLRFGYRMWVAEASGLILKLQTLDLRGRVLEQAAFSQLELDNAVPFARLAGMMDDVRDFRLVTVAMRKTTAQAEGWRLRAPVGGFIPGDCYKQEDPASPPQSGLPLHCLLSDGLATVSLFLERYDASRHPAGPSAGSMGATQTLAQRVSGNMWLTAVGEVPQETLRLVAEQLEYAR